MSRVGLLQPSVTVHDHPQPHLSTGPFLKSLVYGGMDGVINTTIILLTGMSANTPVGTLFSLCLSATVVGALDMALCDYVSTKSEMHFVKLEEERELYQIQHFLDEEKMEMEVIYHSMGYSQQDSGKLVELLATSKQAFANIMLMEQLGLVKSDDNSAPLKCGITTFAIFLITGLLTMSPYFVTWLIMKEHIHPWPYVLAISAIQLTSLGFAKGKILGLNVWKSAFQFVLLGAVGTTIGFFIGKLFEESE